MRGEYRVLLNGERMNGCAQGNIYGLRRLLRNLNFERVIVSTFGILFRNFLLIFASLL